MARESVGTIWGSGTPANVVEPSAGTQSAGYLAVKPPYQEHNWLFNLMTNMLQNAEQNGIMEWSTDTAYPQYGLSMGSDGKVYQSQVSANQSNDPTTDAGTNWLEWLSDGVEYSAAGNGYLKLPSWMGGFIIQWKTGVSASAESSQTISFPLEFPTSVFQVFVTYSQPADTTSSEGRFELISKTTTSAVVHAQYTNSVTGTIIPHIFAIGV